jgi:hypothetical protein
MAIRLSASNAWGYKNPTVMALHEEVLIRLGERGPGRDKGQRGTFIAPGLLDDDASVSKADEGGLSVVKREAHKTTMTYYPPKEVGDLKIQVGAVCYSFGVEK